MYQPLKQGSIAFLILGALLWRATPGAAAPAATAPTEPQAFVLAATEAGLMEVEASRVAMNASTNSAVKNFADRMITDHGKAGAELAAIAKKKGITVPTQLDAEYAKKLQSLRDKSVGDFDAAYAMQMAQDHSRAVELFQANVHNTDGELAVFAAKTLPVLQEHKRMADNLNTDVKTSSEGGAPHPMPGSRK